MCSVRGSKDQYPPGKKTWWKSVKAASKATRNSAPTIAKATVSPRAPRETARQKGAARPDPTNPPRGVPRVSGIDGVIEPRAAFLHREGERGRPEDELPDRPVGQVVRLRRGDAEEGRRPGVVECRMDVDRGEAPHDR